MIYTENFKSAQKIGSFMEFFLRFLGSIQYAMELEKYLSWLKYSSGDWIYLWPVVGLWVIVEWVKDSAKLDNFLVYFVIVNDYPQQLAIRYGT